jgi:hypothetical protein
VDAVGCACRCGDLFQLGPPVGGVGPGHDEVQAGVGMGQRGEGVQQ